VPVNMPPTRKRGNAFKYLMPLTETRNKTIRQLKQQRERELQAVFLSLGKKKHSASFSATTPKYQI